MPRGSGGVGEQWASVAGRCGHWGGGVG